VGEYLLQAAQYLPLGIADHIATVNISTVLLFPHGTDTAAIPPSEI
jgi:hypothetical protein